ncbi:glutathione S-transferase N-terminal domain-containing protein [Arenibaculum sp.]|jgi:glutathione S-transferase|uniref:glutathione S-transferase N-terminal domain-containing protein n=1 Tax=Arenibaculum sp. TaxID=2865862 RepID=UPI002E103F6D|nr:glutathione S-transferase N-terminal domain-containing protein [Arenibaculum sp.]
MKFYHAPGACSLAAHILLHEAGLAYEPIRVDIPTRRTEAGDNFAAVNPKGYVPALAFEDGRVLTENVAILDWLSRQAPELAPRDEAGRTRLIEMLAFLSTELHKPFIRLFFPAGDAERDQMAEAVAGRFDWLAGRIEGGYLLDGRFGAADAFLYVMSRWAGTLGVPLPGPVAAHAALVEGRPSVQAALRSEGLS